MRTISQILSKPSAFLDTMRTTIMFLKHYHPSLHAKRKSSLLRILLSTSFQINSDPTGNESNLKYHPYHMRPPIFLPLRVFFGWTRTHTYPIIHSMSSFLHFLQLSLLLGVSSDSSVVYQTVAHSLYPVDSSVYSSSNSSRTESS